MGERARLLDDAGLGDVRADARHLTMDHRREFVAGHQIERQARMHKRYDITVRMNDGSTRAFSDESGTPLALKSGDKVRVSKDGLIRPI